MRESKICVPILYCLIFFVALVLISDDASAQDSAQNENNTGTLQLPDLSRPGSIPGLPPITPAQANPPTSTAPAPVENVTSPGVALKESKSKSKEPPLPGRITTFVFSPDNIYIVRTKYGYQTDIEFQEGESIQTISLGDPVGFKIVPTGNRIFINTLQTDRHTNMTVITDRRTYQFELSSRIDLNNDITYVAKFYYTDETTQSSNISNQPLGTNLIPSNYTTGGQQPTQQRRSNNRNFSFSGNASFTPEDVYDDGSATYFKFGPGIPAPRILSITRDGSEVEQQIREMSGYVVVNTVAKSFALRRGSDIICVFNESGGQR